MTLTPNERGFLGVDSLTLREYATVHLYGNTFDMRSFQAYIGTSLVVHSDPKEPITFICLKDFIADTRSTLFLDDTDLIKIQVGGFVKLEAQIIYSGDIEVSGGSIQYAAQHLKLMDDQQAKRIILISQGNLIVLRDIEAEKSFFYAKEDLTFERATLTSTVNHTCSLEMEPRYFDCMPKSNKKAKKKGISE